MLAFDYYNQLDPYLIYTSIIHEPQEIFLKFHRSSMKPKIKGLLFTLESIAIIVIKPEHIILLPHLLLSPVIPVYIATARAAVHAFSRAIASAGFGSGSG